MESKNSTVASPEVRVTILGERVNPNANVEFERLTLIRYKNLRFKAVYRVKSSIPCGFDSDHCLKIMSPLELTWVSVADYTEIWPDFKRRSYNYNSDAQHKTNADLFTQKCIEYIELIYQQQ